MKGFTLFQDPSGFVHQHLAPSVGIDTKTHVGSLSIFHLRHESAETKNPKLSQKTHGATSSLTLSLLS
ncbi:hypothetical protein DVH24_009062 [Malus domestica]|uniref:Uncharacterized protein n=1 Tax=Malus domestica TaxID=3750 RepID=A0A498JLF4_MALDO|nr:hypothetical protein DVH24_009062 [Malus domestica]